jgi:hypothetical protein
MRIKVIGDQVKQEVGGDPGDPAMFGLTHRSGCLPQPKVHSIMARRDCDMP